MTRLLTSVMLLMAFSAQAAPQPEKWWDAYDRGVTAVNNKNYKVAAEALQKAIAEMPNEGTNVRTKRTLITYVPHFWLGIAKFNLGDADGALREWKISQDQGVVARTEYYSKMKDWVASAEAAKVRDAQRDATGPKTAASAAISKAMLTKGDALSANGERTDSYQAAKRKLDEAKAIFGKAGTDVNAYRNAEQIANQATSLFVAAVTDGKKQKDARDAATVVRQNNNRAATPRKLDSPAVQQAAILTPQPAPVKVLETPPPPLSKPPAGMTPVLTEAEVAKQIAEQEAKRKKVTEPKKTASVDVAGGTAAPMAKPEPLDKKTGKLDLKPAYRAFASGDVAASERLLNDILKSQQAAEAYLLRGCARYTRAMLSRDGNRLLMMATDDFRAALDRNRGLRLDRRAFSPKLVAFFEGVRKQR